MPHLKINFNPNTWQKQVLQHIDTKRFFIVSAGRQSGKTYLGVFLIGIKALTNANSINWWVAPTYTPAKMAFRRVLEFLNLHHIKYKVNRSDLRIELSNKSVIEFKSGDREESVRGETVNFLIIDEMGLLKRDAWSYALRGCITATQGQVMFIGTPKGKNLFYELYLQGLDKEEEDFVSYQFSSKDSEFFPSEEWSSVQRLPERIFQQEYQAMFIDDGGEVFRNIRDCIKGKLDAPNAKKSYYLGIDLAKSVDYTVVAGVDDRGHLCIFDRFNDIAWSVQKERIKTIVSKYPKSTIIIDSTGVGDPIFDDLLNAGLSVKNFHFTNINKRHIVEALSMAVERQDITFPEIPELINELNIFTFETLPSGMIRYSAPAGLHDDIVIAMALAWECYGGGKSFGEAFSTDGDRMVYDW